MPLQGNLTDLPLIDLMQVLAMQSKTGILSVNRDFSQAQICFNQSRIYSAFSRHTGKHQHPVDYQGEAALYDLLGWPDGQFCFELTSSLPGVQNVNVTWNYVVLEYCRRQDEHGRQKEFERLAAQRPRLLPNPPVQAQITLDLEDWQVLLQVNNQLTLQEIAGNIRFELTQVIKITQKLAKQGLLEIDSTIPATQRVAVEAGAASWQANSTQTPGWRNSPQPYRQQQHLPLATGEREIQAKGRPGTTPIQPKIQRGLLSGIVAKIRGL